MVENNEQLAYFSVSGDFDPAMITARVGVQPTECWRRGDTCPRRLYERKFSRWSLYSRLGRNQELVAHVADVLTQLDANPEAFGEVSRECGGVMQLVSYLFCNYPGLFIERGITERLHAVSLAIVFDFYLLYSNRREDT